MGFFSRNYSEDEEQDVVKPVVQEGFVSNERDRISSVEQLFSYALEYISMPDHNWLSSIMQRKMTKESFFSRIRQELNRMAQDENMVDEVCKQLDTYIWGYYIIEEYINDPTISDIRILDANHIRLKKNGKRIDAVYEDGEEAGQLVHFIDDADYVRFVNLICSRNRISLADNNAIQTFTDSVNNENARLRFNITSGILNTTEMPYVQVRKIPKKKRSIDSLCEESHMMPPEVRDYLKEKVTESVLFTGKGASGKTTLMNAMLDLIPTDKSALVIEENNELFSDHPDMMFQHIITSRGEGHIQYALKDLATNGLLTDLDYFIIGEIKGDEAAHFMNAAYTGHKCWSSVHGMNSQEAIRKLADYVTYATRYSLKDAFNMLRFMNVVVFMKDFKVQEISEVTGIDNETGELTYKLVYRLGEVNTLKK